MTDIVITVDKAKGSVLALIRAIKQDVDCKSYVLCTDQLTAQIIGSSKFVDEVYYFKNKSDSQYVNEIKEWRNHKNFSELPVLYFTADTSCYIIDKERDWFEQNFKLCLPSSEIIRAFTEKGVAEIKALEAGLNIPKTQIINSEKDTDIVLENFEFPIILKPRATYLKNSINFKTKLIENKESLKEIILPLINKDETLLCQEFIPGNHENAYYYLFYRGEKGDIYENMGKKTLQSPPNGGIMAKGLVEYNKDLAEICQRFLHNINYKGIGGIEFKKYNDVYYFIEMSVRLEGFFQIAETNNSSLSLASYYDICKHNNINRIFNRTSDGSVYVDFTTTFITRLKQKHIRSLFKDTIEVCFNPKVKLNLYSSDDKKPFFKLIKNFLFK